MEEPGAADGAATDSGKSMPFAVLAAGGPTAETSRWLWKKDMHAAFELLVRGRAGRQAGLLTVAVNGRQLYKATEPFKNDNLFTLRISVPTGALKEEENLLTLNFEPEKEAAIEQEKKAAPAQHDDGADNRVKIYYAVLKRLAGK